MERNDPLKVVVFYCLQHTNLGCQSSSICLVVWISGDNLVVLNPFPNHRFINTHDDHLVICQEFLFDGLTECQLVNDWAKDSLIIHTNNCQVISLSRILDGLTKVPWCRCREEPFRRPDLGAIKDSSKPSISLTCASVGFISYG